MINDPIKKEHKASVTDIALMRRRKLFKQEGRAKLPWIFGRDTFKKMQQPCKIIPFPAKRG